jgi:hypothetical protein
MKESALLCFDLVLLLLLACDLSTLGVFFVCSVQLAKHEVLLRIPLDNYGIFTFKRIACLERNNLQRRQVSGWTHKQTNTQPRYGRLQ